MRCLAQTLSQQAALILGFDPASHLMQFSTIHCQMKSPKLGQTIFRNNVCLGFFALGRLLQNLQILRNSHPAVTAHV